MPSTPPSQSLLFSNVELAEALSLASFTAIRFVADMAHEPAFMDGDTLSFATDPHARQLPGEHGRPLAELLKIVDRAGRLGLNGVAGDVLAYIPGSGLPTAAIADLIAGIYNAFTGVGFCAPGMVALEHDVIRWLTHAMGLPETAGGILTSGGSMATLSAITCAREVHFGDGPFARGTIYLTDQAHHCIAKAARIAGFRPSALRVIPTDERHRMNVYALEAAILRDREAGYEPFFVAATAGTTNTGSIDPLESIAAITEAERLWLHVDGAYGGLFRMTARGRQRLRGMERADSLVLDPHKSLFLPYGTGCLLVRDRDSLRVGHGSHEAAYMRDLGQDRVEDFSTISLELTRPNRGLGMWLALHLHGVAAFRAALDEKMDLAVKAHEELGRIPGLKTFGEPELSIATFHCSSADLTLDEENTATGVLAQRVNDRRNVFISTTRVGERVIARLAVLNLRTSAETMERAIHDIHLEASGILARLSRDARRGCGTRG
jgi:aromatic-L-amino-acid/L-tryptophan decarboxylase